MNIHLNLKSKWRPCICNGRLGLFCRGGDLGVKFSPEGIASITRKIPHVLMSSHKLQVKNAEGKWTELTGDERKKALDTLKSMKSISLDDHDAKQTCLFQNIKVKRSFSTRNCWCHHRFCNAGWFSKPYPK